MIIDFTSESWTHMYRYWRTFVLVANGIYRVVWHSNDEVGICVDCGELGAAYNHTCNATFTNQPIHENITTP